MSPLWEELARLVAEANRRREAESLTTPAVDAPGA
jgi:hypothetical protein